MLKINLLPPYIYEGAKRRNVLVLWAVILLGVIGGSVYGKIFYDGLKDELQKKIEATEPTAKKADDTQAAATSLIAKTATLKQKADFVRNALIYNQETYPGVFDNVNMYTINKVLYSGVTPAGSSVNIDGYAPSLVDVGHYMLAMEKNPNISNVSIAMSVPGFDGETAGQGGGLAPGGRGGGAEFGPGGRGGGGGFGGGGQRQPGLRPPGGGGHDFTATLSLVSQIPVGPSYGGGGGGGQGGGSGGGGMGGALGNMPSLGAPGGGMSSAAGMSAGGGKGGGKKED